MQKLTPGEISQTVAKIRQKYDDYTYKFFKPKRVKEAFELRYVQALRNGLDISSFLVAEISAVSELVKREEARVAGPVRTAGTRRRSMSATDRILEEHRQKLLGYPDIQFHTAAHEEIRRMLGALDEIFSTVWADLMRALRNTSYANTSTTMSRLENDLRYLGYVDSDGFAAALTRYANLLEQFPRDYNAVEREENNYLRRTATFLHEFDGVLAHIVEAYPQLEPEDMARVREVKEYVEGLIVNFRFQALKPRK